ncbi:putative RNA polymerase II subunit B1 CTD phosphatase rpap-2 [Aphelenchoides fujianensis]|nr:putative RNA polymerase II subunit B1 CTD phosphatase rpap-2 [Aphelenchoides fujianensis]
MDAAKKPEIEATGRKEAAEEEKARLVKKARRKVVDTITHLVDTVEEYELLEKLHVLDAGSWDEVIEERYLASSCGFPTCSRQVLVQNTTGRRFRIDRREKKVYTALPLWEKFCSTACYERSCHVQGQLYEEPLWFSLERKQRAYDLDVGEGTRPPRKPEEIFVDQADRLLVTRLNEMKIADSFAEDEEQKEDEELDANREDEEFLNEIRSFVSSVSQMSARSKASMMGVPSGGRSVPSAGKPAAKRVEQPKESNENPAPPTDDSEPKDEEKVELPASPASKPSDSGDKPPSPAVQWTKPNPNKFSRKEVDEKLAKLRAKYGQKQQQKKPELIEAPPMSAEKAAKLSEDMR